MPLSLYGTFLILEVVKMWLKTWIKLIQISHFKSEVFKLWGRDGGKETAWGERQVRAGFPKATGRVMVVWLLITTLSNWSCSWRLLRHFKTFNFQIATICTKIYTLWRLRENLVKSENTDIIHIFWDSVWHYLQCPSWINIQKST